METAGQDRYVRYGILFLNEYCPDYLHIPALAFLIEWLAEFPADSRREPGDDGGTEPYGPGGLYG
jgi:hypothetical protein